MRTAVYRGWALACALAGIVASALACGSSEAPPEPTGVAKAERGGSRGPGRILYLTHCESCHGPDARGQGTVASALRTPAPNLTVLWQEYGTPLDRERLAEYIDGRRVFAVYGARGMPIWGEEFFRDVPASTPDVEVLKARLIGVLVEYLETVQTEQRI